MRFISIYIFGVLTVAGCNSELSSQQGMNTKLSVLPYVDLMNDKPPKLNSKMCYYEMDDAKKHIDEWAIICDKPMFGKNKTMKSQLVSAQMYENGKRNGPSFRWNELEQLSSVGVWKDDGPFDGSFLAESSMTNELDSDGQFGFGDLPIPVYVFKRGRPVFDQFRIDEHLESHPTLQEALGTVHQLKRLHVEANLLSELPD